MTKETKEKWFIKNFWESVKNVTTPTTKAWFNLFWQVSLILIIAGTSLFFLDYLFLNEVLFVQALLPTLQSTWAATIFFSIYAVFLAFTVVGILSQKGTDSSLSTMLGSTTQSSDVTGFVANRVAKITAVLMVLTVVLTFFAPIFAKGI